MILKNLSEKKGLVIQKAEKGNTVVVLDKNNYISRINGILADTSNFRKLHL